MLSHPFRWVASSLEQFMSNAKEAMAEIIARQPDDSSYDEIFRELAYARMVKRGLEDSDAGRTVSDDVIYRKIESWRK
jgi:predicted transcriptional regulator